MLDTINENEEMGNEKLTISIPKKVIEEVDRDEPDRKLSVLVLFGHDFIVVLQITLLVFPQPACS